MIFKIGEKYKVSNAEINENGNIIEITEIDFFSNFVFYKTLKGKSTGLNKFQPDSFFAKNLTPIKYNSETIVIYRKDNEVVALDKSTGKKAVAKCSTEDTFNFKTGAKLAFERLTNKVTFRMLCIEDVYFSGDLGLKKGKVYEYVNGNCRLENGLISGTYDSYENLIDNNMYYKNSTVELKDGDDPKEILNKIYGTIKVGDTVTVVDNGLSFTSYYEFFKDNNIDVEIAARYKYGESLENGGLYKVIAIGELELYPDKGVVIKNNYGECYLIQEKGLKKC